MHVTQQVLRALLVLGLATMAHATRRDHGASVKSGPGGKLNGRMVRLHLDPSMQPRVTRTSSSTIANMSLSPWTYRESCVASRLPMRIYQAQCLTSGCLSLQGGGEDEALEAKPIYYQVLVLHRVQKRLNKKGGKNSRNRYVFQLGIETIPVGCTCVRPSVIPQQ